ncbi:MAG: O-antigen ligase family protein [Planctomycetota bacterium]|jgi:tetratricopeptide (TPR) repeat protein
MRESRFNTKAADFSASRFDAVIEGLLIALLAFMPLAFGGVEAWSEQAVLALAAAISVCFLLKLVLDKDANVVWSWAYVPIALFILVVVLQLIPLPAAAVRILSANTVAVKNELLADLPHSGEFLKSMTVSFYPNATKHDLRLILAVAAVFVVVLNTFREPRQVKRLLGAIAIIGGSIALLALAQQILGNGKIYWVVPPGVGRAYSGPFVCHSHYGQFMNLSIGAALALMLVRAHEAFTGKKVSPAVVFEHLGSPAARALWFLAAMIVLGAATIFVSLTRGGMISLFIAAGFTTVVLSSRQSLKSQGWIVALLALGAFICVLYIGFDAVYDRLATLRELRDAEGGRWQILKDIATAWTKFPLLGTGLGTHAVVYPMFDRSTIAALAAYAENEYAQAAEETGIVGLVTLVGFGILVWVAFVRNVRTASVPIRSAAYGLGFGLLAIMLHSLSDFGQHLPANGVLSAAFCALMLGLARPRHKAHPSGRATIAPRWSRGLRIAALVCVSGIWGWALLGANTARLAEANWEKAFAAERGLSERNWQGSDEEYIALISHAAKAADYQPDNVEYRHWLNVYRWRSLSRMTDPNTGSIVIPEQAVGSVRRIAEEFHKVCLLCPTYGTTYCVVGQLERFVLNDPNGADRIRRGFELAPCDPTACFVAGLLDVEEQQLDASFEKFSRAVELDGRLFRNVADVYIYDVGRPDLAVAIAGDNRARLSYVANALADMQEHKDVAEKAQARVFELLKEQCSGADAPASALASLADMYRKQGDCDAAIQHYRRALIIDYGQVQWRFALARLLREEGRIPEAMSEANICRRLRPQFKEAEKLIEELSVLPGAVTEVAPGR